MKIEDVVSRKGVEVVTIAPASTIEELVGVLAEHRIGAVVVSSDGRTIEGIISERDVVRDLATSGAATLGKTVADLMTADVTTAKLSDRIEDTAHAMTVQRIRHLPVVVDGRLHAIVSIGDIVKHRIDQLTDERNHLLGYLHT